MTDKEPTQEQIKECPFGFGARTCEHQETFTNDLIEAIKGDVMFVCRLKDADCPKLQGIFEEVIKK